VPDGTAPPVVRVVAPAGPSGRTVDTALVYRGYSSHDCNRVHPRPLRGVLLRRGSGDCRHDDAGDGGHALSNVCLIGARSSWIPRDTTPVARV
jgi:hypothetical protein